MATVGDVPFETLVVLKRVLKSALIADGVARGLNEVARTLDKREAFFCVLAKDCDEASYEKLVRALCFQHEIPIIEMETKAELGESIGQCKYDKEGKARKVVGCSCAVVKNYGRDDDAQQQLEEYFKKTKASG
ncbi:ribosomal protein l7Ae/L30e/S12e/Gadd45 family domain-containing protein [Ditylenchus destructor]|uniref:40S ribosomal protein S12 n=1 Tax=Ditylenchus destructor TaxID=166010 RepID=A0AAD4NEC4_9BILA|nr:ribosomal protein l7Ae/L30e/S12e/Gadd45 family domain-containing protein [Ditylenchus destructor]